MGFGITFGVVISRQDNEHAGKEGRHECYELNDELDRNLFVDE